MYLRSIVNMGDVIDSAVGINIWLNPDGSKEISYCILKKKKDTLMMVASGGGFSDFQDIDETLKKSLENAPRLHVNIVGRSVLTKKTVQVSGKEFDFNNLFPGFKKEDFIFFNSVGVGGAYHSLIRKDDVLKENLLLHNTAHTASLGYTILELVGSVFHLESIVLQNTKVNFKDGGIESIGPSGLAAQETVVDVSGQSLSSGCILAYAAAVNLFIHPPQTCNTGLPDSVQESALAYKNKREVFVTGRAVLFSVLVILMLNTIIFFFLNGKVSEAQESLQLFRGRLERNTQQSKRNVVMTSAYDNIGWRLNRLPLFYADQVAASVPENIQLTLLETGVLNNAGLRQVKKLSFDSSLMHISGTSPDPVSLSNWISALQRYSWVNKVTDQRYQFDQRIGQGVFEFYLQIK
jgi:hypothetical protein